LDYLENLYKSNKKDDKVE